MKDDTISRQAAIETVRKAQSIGQAHRMLIQLPSAQLAQDLTNGCTDTISRQAAIDAFDEIRHVLDKKEKELTILPSAQPGWIPVTDRLPDMTDTYLVQVGINENGEGMHTEVRTAVWNVVWHKWYVHTTRCFVGDIIKWMPIPWEGGAG